ncbi:MAG: MBL fold metallo-hydrolase, partial [Pseudomonadota bacterium]
EQAKGPEPTRQIRTGLLEWLLRKLTGHGCRQTPDQVEALLGMDLDLNAQGLVVWLERNDKKKE